MDKKALLQELLEIIFESFSVIAHNTESRNGCGSETAQEVCSFKYFKAIWKEKNVSEIVHNCEYSPSDTIHFNFVTDTWREEYKKSLKELFEWLVLQLFQFPKSRNLTNSDSCNIDHLVVGSTTNNNNDTSRNKSTQRFNCTVCSPDISMHVRCYSLLDEESSHFHSLLTNAFIWNVCIIFMLYCVHQTQLFRTHGKLGEEVFIRISLESFQLLTMSIEGYINTFYYNPIMRENNAAKMIMDRLLSVSAFQIVYLPIYFPPGDMKAKVFRSQIERAQHLKSHQERLVVRIRNVCQTLSAPHEHKLRFLNILGLVPSIMRAYSEYTSKERDKLAAATAIADSTKLEHNNVTGIPSNTSGEVAENGSSEPHTDDSDPIVPSNAEGIKAEKSTSSYILESIPEDISDFDEFFFGTAEVQDIKKKSVSSYRTRQAPASIPVVAENIPSQSFEVDADEEIARILAALEEKSQEVLGTNSLSQSSKAVHDNSDCEIVAAGVEEDDDDDDDDAWMHDVVAESTPASIQDACDEGVGLTSVEESAGQAAQDDLAWLLQAIEEQSSSILQGALAQTSSSSSSSSTYYPNPNPNADIDVGNKRKLVNPVDIPMRMEAFITAPPRKSAQENDLHTARGTYTGGISPSVCEEQGDGDMEHLLGLLEQQSAAVFDAANQQQPCTLDANAENNDGSNFPPNGKPSKKRKSEVNVKVATRSLASSHTTSAAKVVTARSRKGASNERISASKSELCSVESSSANAMESDDASAALVDQVCDDSVDIAALLSSLEEQAAAVLLVAPSLFPPVARSTSYHDDGDGGGGEGGSKKASSEEKRERPSHERSY